MEHFYFETTRLKLFPLHPDFAEEFYRLILDTFDTLNQWMSFAEHRPSVECLTDEFQKNFEAFTENRYFRLGVYLKAENKFIGVCRCDDIHPPIKFYKGVRPFDIGYWLHKDYFGKGYTVEAAEAVINYANKTKGVKVFSLHTRIENEKSINVAERLNFKLISTERISMRIKRTDWPDKVLCKIFILEL